MQFCTCRQPYPNQQMNQMEADRLPNSLGAIGHGGVARIVAPMGAAERLQALQPRQQEATAEVLERRRAAQLAVKASDGNRDDIASLAVLFADLKRAEDTRRHLEDVAERLLAEAKAEGAHNG